MRAILYGLLSIATLWLFFGVLYLLGKTGQLVRRGVETRKALKKLETGGKGLIADGKSSEFNRKSTLWIMGPVLGWAGVYLILLLVLPFNLFLFSLLAVIVPALGYFDVFFVPNRLWARWSFNREETNLSSLYSGGNNGHR